MRRVVILASGKTVASTFAGPMDVFHQAGRLMNRITGEGEKPFFDVTLVTVDGKPFETITGMKIVPHTAMARAPKADLVVISALASLNSERYPGAVEWLKSQAGEGADLASVCTGAFLLAATGLLDGKTATTHWAFADTFRAEYPSVNLKPERIITDEGRLFTSAGFTAGMDLSLYLVEKYCGFAVASGSARAMVYDLNRSSQTPYSVFSARKNHGDAIVLRIQNWMENHFEEKLSYPGMCRKFGQSVRTFERRFLSATGMTPLQYLHAVRIEAAKRLLAESSMSFDEITWKVGYGDGGFLRKVFLRETGMKPADYRRRFGRQADKGETGAAAPAATP